MAKLLLQHHSGGQYSVRVLTRNPESTAARHLADLGAEMVKGDLTDPTTLDAAFEGCWGAFVVTNFYDSVSFPRPAETERPASHSDSSPATPRHRQSRTTLPVKRNKARTRPGRLRRPALSVSYGARSRARSRSRAERFAVRSTRANTASTRSFGILDFPRLLSTRATSTRT